MGDTSKGRWGLNSREVRVEDLPQRFPPVGSCINYVFDEENEDLLWMMFAELSKVPANFQPRHSVRFPAFIQVALTALSPPFVANGRPVCATFKMMVMRVCNGAPLPENVDQVKSPVCSITERAMHYAKHWSIMLVTHWPTLEIQDASSNLALIAVVDEFRLVPEACTIRFFRPSASSVSPPSTSSKSPPPRFTPLPNVPSQELHEVEPSLPPKPAVESVSSRAEKPSMRQPDRPPNTLFSCALLLSLRGRKISLVYLTVYFDGCVDVVFTKVFPTGSNYCRCTRLRNHAVQASCRSA
uniref:DUF547 domain-containing protein n=1 Tax=Ascaris lumbricoides TaxID=6252 RepID=A0A0M3HZU4_ASCLU